MGNGRKVQFVGCAFIIVGYTGYAKRGFSSLSFAGIDPAVSG